MDRTASAITATFAPLMPDQGRRELDPWEVDTVHDVLDAAQAWSDGKLPWHQAATYGTILSPRTHRADTRYSRFVANLWAWRNRDPRQPALTALCTEIERQLGMLVTEQGMFSAADLHQHDHAREWLRTHKETA